MDEIIEKLRKKTPEFNLREIAEPISERVSREKLKRERPITPPELNYRSPMILNRFYSKSPEWILPGGVSANSLEDKAYKTLAVKYQGQSIDYNNLLVQADLMELNNVADYSRSIEQYYVYTKVLPYEQRQEIYEAIILFKSPMLLEKLLRNFPKDYSLDEKGYTIYHIASEIGSIEMLRIIKDHGDDPNRGTNSGLTPIMIACSQGHTMCVSFLHQYGADILQKDTVFGFNSLHHAVYHDQYQTVKYMIQELKTPIGYKDFKGRDALDLAIEQGLSLIATFLSNFIKNTAFWKYN